MPGKATKSDTYRDTQSVIAIFAGHIKSLLYTVYLSYAATKIDKTKVLGRW